MSSSRTLAGEASLLTTALLSSFAATATALVDAPSPKADPGGVRWSLVDAVGYGGLGFGFGVLATWDDRLDRPSGPVKPPAAACSPGGATTLG